MEGLYAVFVLSTADLTNEAEGSERSEITNVYQGQNNWLEFCPKHSCAQGQSKGQKFTGLSEYNLNNVSAITFLDPGM